MSWTDSLLLIPYQSVGPVVFSATREQIVRLVGESTDFFSRGERSDTDSVEVYDSESGSVQIHYSRSDNKCVAVEVEHPSQFIVYGQNLNGLTEHQVLAWIGKYDNTYEADSSGFISRRCGLGVYWEYVNAEDGGEDKLIVVSAIGVCPGYFDPK